MHFFLPCRLTLSLLRTCRMLKTVVKRQFLTSHFGRVERSKLWSLRTCRTLKTEGKRKFWRWSSNPFLTSDVSDAQNWGKSDIFDRTKPDYGEKLRWNGRFWPDWTGLRWKKTVVKWTFLTGLNRTTVENCSKMEDVVVVLRWCFSGGVVVRWCFCGGVVFLWWCGGVMVFLWWWWCF